jgi:hypothetical protein
VVKSLENIRSLDSDLQSKVIDTFVGAIEKVLGKCNPFSFELHWVVETSDIGKVISCAAFLVGAVVVMSIKADHQEDEEQDEESENDGDGS